MVRLETFGTTLFRIHVTGTDDTLKAIAAFRGQQNPRLIDIKAVGQAADNQVRCRTAVLGICGTDRDILASGSPWVPEGDNHLVLGHECLAQVEEVGKGVPGFEAGDWVVPLVRRAKGSRVGRPDLLPPGQYLERGIYEAHGFACSHFIDEPDFLLHVPESILDVAVMSEPVSITEKAVREASQVSEARLPDEREYRPRVLVTGQGPIAMAAVLTVRSRGWECVMLGRDGPAAPRATLAADLGVDYQPLSDWVQEHHDYNPEAETRGFDLILECTGSEQVMVNVATWLRALGTMVWVGAPWGPEKTRLPIGAMMRDAILRNQLFLGTVNSARIDFEAAFETLHWFLEQGVSTERLITERTTLEESLPLYKKRPRHSVKSVVIF